jgi:hypothetical protein
MPYIPAENREQYDELLEPLARRLVVNGSSAGDLNYVVTVLLLTLWQNAPGYGNGSKLRGVLSDVNSEFYDQIMRPYEDRKLRENGPVLPLNLTGL